MCEGVKKMKKVKKLLSVFLVLALLSGVLTVDAGAAKKKKPTVTPPTEPEVTDVIQSGTCGENAAWTLNETTGAFTVSGTGAMTDYPSMGDMPWYASRTKIKTVQVESGITHVGDYAFSYATVLTSAVLADTVTSVGQKAFFANYKLSALAMPGVEVIGDSAFFGCTVLASFQWPENLREISAHAFSNCPALTNPAFTESLQSLGEYAFAYCNSITDLTLPASLTDVAYYAFDSCKGLERVTFAEGMHTMGGYMFRGCSALEEVVLPDGLTAIPPYAFADCTGLRWI